MQKSSFFNSVNGDRKYNASDYAAYFGSFIGNGVYPNPGNNLAVTAVGGMNISVAAGKAWINGYYYENTGTFNMSIDPADGVLKRIDRIVLRLDHLNRQIVLSVLKGTPASTPTASLLTRTSDIYELGIADILINNGDTAILQENITDQRLNNDLCGIVHGTVEQVNTSEIFNQYQAALDSFKKEKYEDFTTWVDNLKDILDESTAGNLLNLINNNTSYLNTHLSETATNAHRASNISITDAEGRFTATNVESALNELFTSANDGKTAVATAITAKGVDASPTDTFPLLATKIGQIETGLKSTIGTIPDFSSYGTSSVMYYAGTITGLSFTPKIVIFTYMDDYFVGEYQNNVSCIYSGILGSGKSLFKASSRYFVLGVENLLDFLPDGFKYSSAGQGTKKSNYTNVKYMAIG